MSGWKKFIGAALSPVGVTLALILVGIWTGDSRWTWTGVAFLSLIVVVLITNEVRKQLEDAE